MLQSQAIKCNPSSIEPISITAGDNRSCGLPHNEMSGLLFSTAKVSYLKEPHVLGCLAAPLSMNTVGNDNVLPIQG
jgi:hypothetical protein